MVHSKDSRVPSHQLSATRLLSSPDTSRHHLEENSDYYPFNDEYSRVGNRGSSPQERNGPLRFGSRFGACHRQVVPPGMFDCFYSCRNRLNQFFAKRKIDQGVRLYSQNKLQAAVKTWLSALKTITQRNEKFTLLGYLYQAYMDFGKYRESLEYAHRQLGISEELDSAPMRSEAYLNLARAHQTLGILDRALSYARYALYNDCGGGSIAGHVHLTVASVSLELGAYSKAMDGFQKALNVAQSTGDNVLLLQVYCGLSELWCRLRDSARGAACAARACDLGRGPRSTDLNTRHHRRALLQMAAALRRRGELGDAVDYCNEALRLAAVAGDQGCYARAIRIAGDVYRRKCDIGKALRHYETAMGAAHALGDRLAQMEAMDGAARCLEALRLQGKICNCRPLEFNTRLLEVATSVGSKSLVRTVRLRLSSIYESLGDEAARARQERAATAAPPPTCARCGEPLAPLATAGESAGNATLATLPCTHIVHSDCLPSPTRRGRNAPDNTAAMINRPCLECASPARIAPLHPPPPPPPPPLQHQPQEFPFGTPSMPMSLRDSDLNSLNSDNSSRHVTSSV